jgi:predicted nucleotidyltransferase
MLAQSVIDVLPEHMEMLAAILAKHLPDREAWAYGSRVNGRARKYSDLDLVIMGDEPLNEVTRFLLKEDLSESWLPFIVHVKDWHLIPPEFQDEILRCYAVIHTPVQFQTSDTSPTSVDEVRSLRGIGWEGDLDAMRSNRAP